MHEKQAQSNTPPSSRRISPDKLEGAALARSRGYGDIYQKQVKWWIRKRSGKPGIARWQFLNWLNPQSPSYNPDLEQAVLRQDWQSVRNLCRQQRKSLYQEEGLYDAFDKGSNHEFVIRDIFLLVGINFGYQVPIPVPNKEGHQIIADFQFEDGRIFEIFGVRFEDYLHRAYEKTKEFPNDLWYVDLRHVSVENDNTAMLGYARVLDSEVCHQQKCGMALFSTPVEQMLMQRVPLLLGDNFDMCKNYLIQLADRGTKWIKDRRNIINQYNDKHPNSPESPAYVPPSENEITRDPEGNEIPQLFQRRRISPLMKMREPSKVAQMQMPQQGGAPDIGQISATLASRYPSSRIWTDAEKVAVYFMRPEALQAALQTVGHQQDEQPMRMVANNWYERMKLSSTPG